LASGSGGQESNRVPPLARRVALLLRTVSQIEAMKKTAEWPFIAGRPGPHRRADLHVNAGGMRTAQSE
jgi:hypothetical protein